MPVYETLPLIVTQRDKPPCRQWNNRQRETQLRLTACRRAIELAASRVSRWIGWLGICSFITTEMVRLPEHRTEAAHLKHEPLDDFVALVQISWHEAPS